MSSQRKQFVRILRICLLVIFILLPTLTPEVWATEEFSPAFGGPGGTQNYDLDCGANGMMTGAMDKFRDWMDQIAVICRTVNSSTGVLGEEYTRGPVGGMGGTRDEIQRCRDGFIVTQVNADYGDFVHRLVLRCERWLADTRQPSQSPDRVDTLILGYYCIGCEHPRQDFRCPGFRVAKALRGRSGIYINSLQMVCDDWDK